MNKDNVDKKRIIDTIQIVILVGILFAVMIVTIIGAVIISVGDKQRYNNVDQTVAHLKDNWEKCIPLKGKLGNVDSILSYYVLGDLNSKEVILGKDGWLFFRSSDDESDGTIGDFTGERTFSDNNLREIYERVNLMQDSASSSGADFVVMYAPNKSAIYHDYMPKEYEWNPVSRADILMDYLKKNGMNSFNPKSVLIEASNEYQTYYKYDTHWNQIGAYLSAKEVLHSFNIELAELAEVKMINEPLKYRYCATDDLANMVGMREMVFNDELNPQIYDETVIDWERMEDDLGKKNLYHVHNDRVNNDDSLLLVCDSFGTSMIPVFSSVISDVYVTSRTGYKGDLLTELNPNYVVLEIVERDADKLGRLY